MKRARTTGVAMLAILLTAVGCNKNDTGTANPGEEFEQAGENIGEGIEETPEKISEEIEDIDDDGDDQLGADGDKPGDLEDIDNDGDDHL